MEDGSPEKIIEIGFTFTHEEAEPDLPPHDLVSEHDTIQQWLVALCAGEIPKKPINNYEIALFESVNEYTLCLFGTNTKQQGNNSITTIDFEPSNMYYRLPENVFENLTQEVHYSNITSQLEQFTRSEQFKLSFLAQAKSIMVSFSGKQIWRR